MLYLAAILLGIIAGVTPALINNPWNSWKMEKKIDSKRKITTLEIPKTSKYSLRERLLKKNGIPLLHY